MNLDEVINRDQNRVEKNGVQFARLDGQKGKFFFAYARRVDDFMRHAGTEQDEDNAVHKVVVENCPAVEGFNVVNSYAEFMNLWRYGWTDGIKRLKQIETSVYSGDTGSLQPVNDFWGNALNMGRVLEGRPDCWFRDEVVDYGSGGKLLHIGINLAANAAVKKHWMMRRGAIIGAVIDALEARGYRCKVSAFDIGGQLKSAIEFHALTLKEMDEPLDLSRLALVVGHPDFYRRANFGFLNRWAYPGYAEYADSTFGKAISYSDFKHIAKKNELAWDDDFTLTIDSENYKNYATIEGAKEEFERLMGQIDVDVEINNLN